MVNQEIRRRARAAGVALWEIAHGLGITDSTFSRKLRFELDGPELERVLAIVEEVKLRHEREAGEA